VVLNTWEHKLYSEDQEVTLAHLLCAAHKHGKVGGMKPVMEQNRNVGVVGILGSLLLELHEIVGVVGLV
jgi:hypothetical protein